jgi:deazaflavin-dependent oxidoreductase (nitroreductase family)
MTQSRKERNHLIIQEFRAYGGSVAAFAGTPLLLLTTIGAKSEQQHVTPVAYLADGDHLLIFAANGGRPGQPDWYHNLVAHPDVTVEVGTEHFAARALVLTGEERDRLYTKQASVDRRFAEFQENTVRTIPVITLLRTEKGAL